MKRFKMLPFFVRWLLITFLILGIVAGGVYAYIALTGQGQITVKEPLSFVGSNTFAVDLFPLETKTAQLTIANASSSNLSVDLDYTISPDPTGKGLTVSIPNKITAPATGQVIVNIQISASKSAVPGTYTVTITFDR